MNTNGLTALCFAMVALGKACRSGNGSRGPRIRSFGKDCRVLHARRAGVSGPERRARPRGSFGKVCAVFTRGLYGRRRWGGGSFGTNCALLRGGRRGLGFRARRFCDPVGGEVQQEP